MNIVRPHVTLGHAKLCAHGVTVSIDQLAERARDLERRIERQLALDVPGIHQPFDLVGIVHACTHRHDAPHAVPVERRQLQPALIPEVDERIVEPDVCDHDISPMSRCESARRKHARDVVPPARTTERCRYSSSSILKLALSDTSTCPNVHPALVAANTAPMAKQVGRRPHPHHGPGLGRISRNLGHPREEDLHTVSMRSASLLHTHELRCWVTMAKARRGNLRHGSTAARRVRSF